MDTTERGFQVRRALEHSGEVLALERDVRGTTSCSTDTVSRGVRWQEEHLEVLAKRLGAGYYALE